MVYIMSSLLKEKGKEKKRKNYDIKLRGSQVMLYVGQ